MITTNKALGPVFGGQVSVVKEPKPEPEKPTAGANLYTNALARWLEQQKTAQGQFTAAQQPLQQAVQMFQPGGSYGAGQRGILEQQAKEAQAQALASQVASGMSSGSLASSTAMRAKSDLAAGLLGVEDTRTQFLNQALQALSGLRGTQAQTTATTVDPTYNPYMSYLSNLMSAQSQEKQSAAAIKSQEEQNAAARLLQAWQVNRQIVAAESLAKLQAESQQRLAESQQTNYSTFNY